MYIENLYSLLPHSIDDYVFYSNRVMHDILHFSFICVIDLNLVPTPTVIVTAFNTQIVGQSLTLQCKVTAVRGITGRVDIGWSSDGKELRTVNGLSPTIMDNSLMYTDSYTISRLNATDNGRVIRCEVVINVSPPIQIGNTVVLHVIGK